MAGGDSLFERALDQHRSGNLTEAAKGYRKLLRRNPRHPDGLYLLGCLEYQSGRHEAAADLLLEAIDIAPDDADAQNALGLALTALEKYGDAELAFRRAIQLENRAEFYGGVGALRRRQNRLPEAIAAYREAVRLDSSLADAHYNLGNALRDDGCAEEALECFRRALKLDGDHFHSLAALGQTLHAAGRNAEAAEYFRKALSLAPRDTGVLCDFGDALQDSGDLAGAAALYARAAGENPRLPRAWYAGGCAEMARSEYIAAIECFKKALGLQADWLEARHNLARALCEIGQVSAALGHFRWCAKQPQEGSAQARAMIALIIPGVPDADNQAVLEARVDWAQGDLPAPLESPARERASGRLKIGYISSFFHRDNWMKPVWGLINEHDRASFEVHLFSDAPAASIRHGYRAHPDDRFFDTTGLSNEALAALVRQAGIDILIDLNGYSNVPRLALFALRPSPLAIGWFNMYATTGMNAFDYLIGDGHVIPVEEERFYSEKILRVPGSYLTFAVEYPVPPVTDPPCLVKSGITFGSFASQYKITNEVAASWSRILQLSPNSSLVLKNKHLASHGSRRFVVSLFEKHDIAPDRVFLEGPEEHYEFLQAYGQIDIALDPFPYNGGTTTTEAIWQGVPVIAFDGDRWASRTSASILRAGGLGDFVARDLAGYIELASHWASAPDTRERLLELRRNMRAKLSASAVCDTRGFARNMEDLYSECWRRSAATPV